MVSKKLLKTVLFVRGQNEREWVACLWVVYGGRGDLVSSTSLDWLERTNRSKEAQKGAQYEKCPHGQHSRSSPKCCVLREPKQLAHVPEIGIWACDVTRRPKRPVRLSSTTSPNRVFENRCSPGTRVSSACSRPSLLAENETATS